MITLNTWLGLWAMLTFYDYKIAAKNLVCLGFGIKHSGKETAVPVTSVKQALTKIKVNPRRRTEQRMVSLAYVFGAPDSGKHTILQNFVNESEPTEGYRTKRQISRSNYAINEVSNGKYLILELPHEDLSQPKHIPSDSLNQAQLFMLVFDNTNSQSFRYVSELYLSLKSKYPSIPCMFVATKCDGPSFENLNLNPINFCKTHGLPQPVPLQQNDLGDLIPFTIKRISEYRTVGSRESLLYNIAIAIGVGLSLAGCYIYRDPRIFRTLFLGITHFFTTRTTKTIEFPELEDRNL